MTANKTRSLFFRNYSSTLYNPQFLPTNTMTEFKTDDSKAPSYISVDHVELHNTEKQQQKL